MGRFRIPRNRPQAPQIQMPQPTHWVLMDAVAKFPAYGKPHWFHALVMRFLLGWRVVPNGSPAKKG